MTVHTNTIEDNQHYKLIKAAADPIGLVLHAVGYSRAEERLEARFGRWRIARPDAGLGFVDGERGTLTAMVVSGEVRFYFVSDGFVEGDGIQCTPFEDVEPL